MNAFLLVALLTVALLTAAANVTGSPPQSIIVPPEIVDLFGVANTPCPGTSEVTCSDGQTCCKLSSQGYGCCPMDRAVCCSDGQHCCPHGTECDLEHLTCVKRSDNSLFLSSIYNINVTETEPKVTLVEIIELQDDFLTCPNSNFQCLKGQSCCETLDGWGCCPTENAICCGDGEHCCPQGSTCDITTATCIWPQVVRYLQTPMLTKKPARRANHFNLPKDDELSCPDLTYSCQKDQTCCETATGWGCCPSGDGICCSDGFNCCPQGSRCNVTHATCDWPHQNYAEGPMSAAMKIFSQLYNMTDSTMDVNICPDQNVQCLGEETCCPLADNKSFGCCPYTNGVCCANGQQCCPEGSQCDLEKHVCVHENIFGQILYQSLTSNREGFHSIEDSVSDILCPDQQFRCGDGQTCCQLDDGGYGCCPMQDATCCEDKIHCCPKDTKCDIERGACVSNWGIPWLNEKWTTPELIKVSSEVKKVDFAGLEIVPRNVSSSVVDCGTGHVTCQDQQTCCPGENTCCKIPQDTYGCCPALNAECCLDGKHCCPSGMECTNDGTSKVCKFPDNNFIQIP